MSETRAPYMRPVIQDGTPHDKVIATITPILAALPKAVLQAGMRTFQYGFAKEQGFHHCFVAMMYGDAGELDRAAPFFKEYETVAEKHDLNVNDVQELSQCHFNFPEILFNIGKEYL